MAPPLGRSIRVPEKGVGFCLKIDDGDRAASEALCAAQPPASLSDAAEAHVRLAEYDRARDCLLQVTVEDRTDLAANLRLIAIDKALAAVRALDEEEQAHVRLLRSRLERHARSGERVFLIEKAQDLFTFLPADPAASIALREALSGSVRTPAGGSLPAVYIPSRRALPIDNPAQLAVEGFPLDGVLLGTTEVTNAQFVEFLNSIEESERSLLIRRPNFLRRARSGEWTPKQNAASLPVTEATWYGAKAFAEWAGGRLPTRAEWEWAHVSGRPTLGADEANLEFEVSRPADVASYAPDALGLYDMEGNVWEWLGTEPSGRRGRETAEIAGGSFSTNRATVARQPYDTVDADAPNGHVGFRVAWPPHTPTTD